MILILFDPCISILERLCLERRFTHEERVEDTSKAPDVHLVAVSLLAEDLGRNILKYLKF